MGNRPSRSVRATERHGQIGGVRHHRGSLDSAKRTRTWSRRAKGKQMADRDRDQVSLDSSDSLLRSDKRTRRLCIVSAKPFPSSTFTAALRTALTPHDELEIVVDRRHEREPIEARRHAATQLSVDRRRQPLIDRQLEIDGFAIVPAPAAGVTTRSRPASAPRPEVSIEELWPEDLEDEERLESVRKFKRARAGRLATWLVLPGLMFAVVILFAPSSSLETLVRWLRPETSTSENRPAPPRQDEQTPPEAHALSVPTDPAEVQRPEFPEALSPVRGARSPSDRAGKSPETEVASETSAAARVAPNPRPMAPSRPTASITTRPIVDTASPDVVATRITSPRFPGLPRVEIAGSTTGAWDHGGTYAVRISDTAGRPLAGADVLLHARMADGTVQSILLNSGSEPGTYQATVPGGSSPVDLRVGITTSDKRVEIPLSP